MKMMPLLPVIILSESPAATLFISAVIRSLRMKVLVTKSIATSTAPDAKPPRKTRLVLIAMSLLLWWEGGGTGAALSIVPAFDSRATTSSIAGYARRAEPGNAASSEPSSAPVPRHGHSPPSRKERRRMSTQATLAHHLNAFVLGGDEIMRAYTHSSVLLIPDG